MANYNINADSLKAQCFGRWSEILSALGVDSAFLIKGKHTPCPICGGNDRYTFKDKSPQITCFCSQCDISGDGINMLQKIQHIPFYQALKLVSDYINGSDYVPSYTTTKTTTTENRAVSKGKIKSFKIMTKGAQLIPSDTAKSYLEKRHLSIVIDRQFESVLYSNIAYLDSDKGIIKGSDNKYFLTPAIIGLLSEFNKKPIGALQIYIDTDSLKKYIDKPIRKKMISISSTGLVGAGVWLTDQPTKTLHIAEGLENLLAVCSSLNTRAGVASGTRALLAGLVIPDHVQNIFIWSDSDNNGKKDAEKLQERYKNTKNIRILAPDKGTDWNDILISKGRAEIVRIFNKQN